MYIFAGATASNLIQMKLCTHAIKNKRCISPVLLSEQLTYYLMISGSLATLASQCSSLRDNSRHRLHAALVLHNSVASKLPERNFDVSAYTSKQVTYEATKADLTQSLLFHSSSDSTCKIHFSYSTYAYKSLYIH